MIEDTRRQLAEARERLRASRNALATPTAPPPAPAEPRVETPEDLRYIPANAPGWLRRRLARIPRWARPAVVGAVALAALTGIRVLAMLPMVLTDPLGLAGAAGAVLLAATAGAAGGLAFTLVRPALEPLGWGGDILAGITCTAAYLGAIVLVVPLAFGEPAVERGDAGILVALGVVFGTVVGHFWFYLPRRRLPPAGE